jgi:hypothetical protein
VICPEVIKEAFTVFEKGYQTFRKMRVIDFLAPPDVD